MANLAISILFSSIISSAVGEYVVTLTDANFDEYMEGKNFVVVEYYAPWCGHCKTLAPHYEKAAELLKDEDIQLTKVDATENEKLAEKAGVQGFPTLKVYRGSSVTEYQGPRDSGEEIADFLRKRAGPASKEVSSAADIEALTGEIVVLGAFSGDSPAFDSAAVTLLDDAVFAKTSDVKLLSKYGVKAAPAVVLVLNYPFEKSSKVLEEIGSEEAIVDGVKASWLPALSEIGPHNFARYPTTEPMVWLFVDKEAEATKEVQEAAAASCKAKDVRCVYLDGVKFKDHGESMGVASVPGMVVMTPEEVKYVYSGEMTTAGFSKFFEDYMAGSLTPTIKSEPVPETQGPVVVLVADQFKEVVLESGNDVAVEFYAPWCGHCKKLTPEWDALGDLYADVEDIVIAKMDATANDVDKKYNVQGFPTLLFFKSDDVDNPIPMEAERTTSGLSKFIQKHTTKKLDTIPVDHNDVQKFLDGYSEFAENARKLVSENKALKAKVSELRDELEKLKSGERPPKAAKEEL